MFPTLVGRQWDISPPSPIPGGCKSPLRGELLGIEDGPCRLGQQCYCTTAQPHWDLCKKPACLGAACSPPKANPIGTGTSALPSWPPGEQGQTHWSGEQDTKPQAHKATPHTRGAPRSTWLQLWSPALGLHSWQLQAGLRQHQPLGFLEAAVVAAEEALGLAVEVLVVGRAGRRPVANEGEGERPQAAAGAVQHLILLQQCQCYAQAAWPRAPSAPALLPHRGC